MHTTRITLFALLIVLAACNGNGLRERPALPDQRAPARAEMTTPGTSPFAPASSTAVELPAAESAVPTDTPANALTNTPASAIIAVSPHLRVDRALHTVEVDGFISLNAGLLEQIACKRGTREHESIFVPSSRPSEIHAAMLLAGFEPGRPGSWRARVDGTAELVPPTGDEVEVLLRVETPEFRPIALFLRDARSGQRFPEGAFVFAGSSFAPNPPSFGPGEHYVADWTGSIVGIVTFGDEVIAWRDVIPDQAEIAEPIWQANPLYLPAPGTPATMLLRRPAPSSR